MMEEHDRPVEERDRGRNAKWIALAVVAVIAIVFIVKNDRSVDIDYIFGTFDIPLVWGLLAALVLGFIAGWLHAFVPSRSRLTRVRLGRRADAFGFPHQGPERDESPDRLK